MLRTPIARTSTLAPSREPKPARGSRMRKCSIKDCRAAFAPMSMTHKVCSPACALIYAKALAAAKERKTDRARKVAMKSRSQWLKEAQTAFNAWIRARDAEQPCISCGRYHDGKYDAGHFRSVGAQPALRFHELNCHKQCVPCNQHKAGNVVEYRIRLVARIGAAAVALLEQDHPPAKFTIDDARAIKADYVARLKALNLSPKAEAFDVSWSELADAPEPERPQEGFYAI